MTTTTTTSRQRPRPRPRWSASSPPFAPAPAFRLIFTPVTPFSTPPCRTGGSPCAAPRRSPPSTGAGSTDPASFDELARRRVDGGEVVTYLQTWEERGRAPRRPPLPRVDARRRPDGSSATRCSAVGGGTPPCSPRWRRPTMLVDVRPVAAVRRGAARRSRAPRAVRQSRRPLAVRVRAGVDRRRGVRRQVRPRRPRLHDAGVGRYRLPDGAGLGGGAARRSPGARSTTPSSAPPAATAATAGAPPC